MNSVKLAPLIGLTADEHVELESLSSLIGTYPFTNSQVHNSTNHTRQFKPIRERSIFTISEAPNTKISETVDANTNKRSGSFKKNKRYRRNRSSPLSIADVNNLWGVYLRQQEELGVNISDKQAMAKKYHELGRKEVKILKHLSGKTESDEDVIIEFSRKKKIKVVPEKVKNVAAARPDKPTNKRQKRKKMIREELKRQLNIFTNFPETEGFPWKAIVSEKGYRNLKMEGWPNIIPISKRIDDFNPSELNIFEESIKNRTMKIVKIEGMDGFQNETEEGTDEEDD